MTVANDILVTAVEKVLTEHGLGSEANRASQLAEAVLDGLFHPEIRAAVYARLEQVRRAAQVERPVPAPIASSRSSGCTKIVFNDVQDFIEELKQDPPPDGILRLTQLVRASATAPIRMIYVVATYLTGRRQIAELRSYCGDDWGREFRVSEKTQMLASQVMARIASEAQTLNLDVRRGMLSDADPSDVKGTPS